MQHPAQKGVPDLPPMSLHEEDIEWPSSAKPSSEDVTFSEDRPDQAPDVSSVKINTAPNEEETLYGAPTVGPLTGRPLRFRDTGGSEEPEEEEADKEGGVEIDTEPKESNRFKGMAFNREEEGEDEIPVSVDLSELPPSAPAASGVRLKGAPSADVVPLPEEEEGEPATKREISGRALAEQSAKMQEEYQRRNIPPYAPSVLYPDGSEEGRDQKPESGVDGGREAA